MFRDGPNDEDKEEFPSFSHFLTRRPKVEATHRYLPHWQLDGGLYFVTWRLADSLPQSLLRQWNQERTIWLEQHPRPWNYETGEAYRRLFPKRIQDWLDSGYGACVLRDPECARCVARVMLRFDRIRYDMASFVIMPNHVHALFQLRDETKLDRLLKAWKGTSAREVNKRIGQRGTLWIDESRDTSIRNPNHLVHTFNYIRDNPAKAGLRAGDFLYYELPGIERQLRGWTGDFDK